LGSAHRPVWRAKTEERPARARPGGRFRLVAPPSRRTCVHARVASTSGGPPSPRRAAHPIHEGQPRRAQCSGDPALPLMASRRRQGRAAAAPFTLP
jgi:hypothetical protein